MYEAIPQSGDRILIVEDESVYTVLASILVPAGYDCTPAKSASEALGLLESGKEFDLMITHIVMPEMDGLTLTERTKKHYPNTPVVIITSVPDGLYVAIQRGAYDCLPKPIERAQLLKVVDRALAYRYAQLTSCYRPERILLQDDEESLREILAAVLSMAHYDCRMVESPRQVLEVLKSDTEFDLIFCGLIESLEERLIDQLFADYPSIPVVVSSACHDIGLFLTALRKGAYDFLIKPFERDQLLAVVGRAVECRRLKLENQNLKQQMGIECKS